MPSHHDASCRGARGRLASEAARLMAEQGIDDPLEARHKAAIRLGLTGARELPTGEEVVAALRDYLALFQAEPHRQRLRKLRGIACDVIRRLAPHIDARLVGPVLDGTAVASSPVTLHLLGITAEEVAIHLLSLRLAFRESARQVSYGPRDRREMPAFLLRQDGCVVELIVFAPDAPRQAPLCPVTGRAQKRAGLDLVCRFRDDPSPHAS